MRGSYSSCISAKDRDRYPYPETIMLFSESGSEGSVNDIASLQALVEALTIDSDTPLVQRVVPVSDISVMTNRNEIFLESVEFCGYDTSTLLLEQAENSEKDYANEVIKGNMVSASWQPNFFRPTVKIGGNDLASNINTPRYDRRFHNLGIGLPLPFCLPINKVIKSPFDIEITASFGQIFKAGETLKVRNYPILAIVTFWHNLN